MTEGMTGSCHSDSMAENISDETVAWGSDSVRYSRIRSAKVYEHEHERQRVLEYILASDRGEMRSRARLTLLLGSSGSTPNFRMAMINACAHSSTFLWL